MPLPDLRGVLSADDVVASARSIAAVQEPWGAIPWFPDGHTDPWDHVESAMALDVAGLHREAVAAYRWLGRVQRADGSWATMYRHGEVEDPMTDANHTAYIAVGVWHHTLITGDRTFLDEMWPTVRAALECVLGLQAPTGEIWWARDSQGEPVRTALLTGCSSIYHALRCGLAIADRVGSPQPEWELAAGALRHALVRHPEYFEGKDRFSMDWYYPVLGGALRGPAAHERIAARWDDFVVPGLGIRCVSDEPWATGAETCELALALDTIGRRADALAQLTAMQHLRRADGSYWTGYQFVENINWPDEQTTWTAAAVILAADALSWATPGSGIFRAEDLPRGVDLGDTACGDETTPCHYATALEPSADPAEHP